MSTLQLASDTTGRVIVEWNKYAPHFRVITDDSRVMAYADEDKAMRCAKRICRRLGLTLRQDYQPMPNQPMPYQLMAQAFPDYDQRTLPAIPPGWKDSSWRNDTCPSFSVTASDDTVMQVFIDYQHPADRELPECKRFAVTRDEEDGSVTCLLETDGWRAVLELVGEDQA